PPSIGKSHIAAQIAKSTQKMGGIVVLIDSESSTSVENLQLLGVNIGKNLIYCDAVCTERVFEIAEGIILKTRALKKDVPVTIIWDSVAATSPKA
ncbi:DNA recombination/repair protein RecA, partial [Mangrovimonas sp. AS39]|nr:DNA recombination/repair protein RecA [Mangrovimonas futianensis]